MCAENIVTHFEDEIADIVPITEAINAELEAMEPAERVVIMEQFQEAFSFCESMAAWHRFLRMWIGFGEGWKRDNRKL